MKLPNKYLPAQQRCLITIGTVIELAAEQNPSEITTKKIAQHMGLTQGAIFRHFSSKEALFQSVIEWIVRQLMSRIETASYKKSSCLAALESTFMTHINFITEYPGIPRILFGELQRSEETEPKRIVQALIHWYQKHLIGLLEQGKSIGEFDKEINVEAAAMLFIGTIQGLVMQSLIIADTSHVSRNAAEIFAIYRRGIRSLS